MRKIYLLLLILVSFLFAWCFDGADDNQWNLETQNLEQKSEIVEDKKDISTEVIETKDSNFQVKINVKKEDTWTTELPNIPESTQSEIETKTYTLQDVSIHNKKENCRTVVDWKVYDLTSAFGKHPWWDENLMKICGIDWTLWFDKKHWNSEKAKW
jgi:cytochrome b involved in lipid metabolism